MALLWKSILSDMRIATPAFFSCPFAWKICFQPFTFSLCKSIVLRWVSCRQHICGSCFLIHSGTLCLLIGVFNPFTFKVIIDSTYSLPFSSLCTCVPFSLTVFLPLLKAVSFASIGPLICWTYILLDFFCLGNSLFGLLS